MRHGWKGPIGFENLLTGDGRMLAKNAMLWDAPMPFRYQLQDSGGHDNAYAVGNIFGIERDSTGALNAFGDIDDEVPGGPEALAAVKKGIAPGVSMDLDDVTFEIRVRAELLTAQDVTQEDLPPADSDGRVTVETYRSDDVVQVTTSALIRSATLVQIPAFKGAKIELTGEVTEGPSTAAEAALEASAVAKVNAANEATLLASSFPVAPPAAWFNTPTFEGPTPLRITADGHVSGHLALWGTCHTGFKDNCTTAPRSRSGYAYFHTGAVLTAEGAEFAVGHITLDTGHANVRASATAAAAHYDNTGAVAADVRVGEDAHGIWVTGALRPTLTDSQVRALRAAPLSGDWRTIGGRLELIAALAVNVPGFPVPRTSGLVASTGQLSLVAAGVMPQTSLPRAVVEGLSEEDLTYLRSVAHRERVRQAAASAASTSTAAELARRMQASTLALRFRSATTDGDN